MLYGVVPNRLVPYGEYVDAVRLTTEFRLLGRAGKSGADELEPAVDPFVAVFVVVGDVVLEVVALGADDRAEAGEA